MGGQIWTFLPPFSYVHMDIVDICQPPSPPYLVHVVIERPPDQNSQMRHWESFEEIDQMAMGMVKNALNQKTDTTLKN